jgi:DNA-binding NtrC family response regulator
LSEELILSELFGHVRGAFTGAVAHKNGKLELADRGTLFLDEIGEMPLSIQAKLLKVIEDRCFERVGGVKKIFVDLHLMTATNRDLQQMVRKGSFREDLYFRLKVMELHIPPLRERKADIDVLVDFFADKYAGQYNKHHLQFSREALDLMREYDWPGNVRELQNTVNRLVLLAKRPSIGKKELEELAGFINIPRKTPGSAAPVNGENPGSLPAELPGTGRETPPGPDRGTLQERLLPVTAWYEKHIILETLKKHGGNKTRAAEELGITRQTVLNKLRHYSLPT